MTSLPAAAAMIRSLAGAGVEPSPKMAVVMPWVTLEMTRPSPSVNAATDCAWMSMKPGATTFPVASSRCLVSAFASMPGGVIREIRSPRMAMSP